MVVVLVVEGEALALYLMVQDLLWLEELHQNHDLRLLLADLLQFPSQQTLTLGLRLLLVHLALSMYLEDGLELFADQHILLVGVVLRGLSVDEVLVVEVELGVQQLGHLQAEAQVAHVEQTVVHLVQQAEVQVVELVVFDLAGRRLRNLQLIAIEHVVLLKVLLL